VNPGILVPFGSVQFSNGKKKGRKERTPTSGPRVPVTGGGELRATWAKGEGNRASAQRRKREGAALAGPFRPKSERGGGVASFFCFFSFIPKDISSSFLKSL